MLKLSNGVSPESLDTVKAVAYVASTLPIALLDQCVRDWGVSRIVIHGRSHFAAYQYFQQRHPKVALRVLPDSSVLKILCALFVLLEIKLTKGRIFFFHECCCPFFDLLVKLIKPNGHYYPHVTLHSFVQVPASLVPRTITHSLIGFLKLDHLFTYHKGEADNDMGHFFVQAIKSYPRSIHVHRIDEREDLLRRRASAGNYASSENRLLILSGRDVQADETVELLYRQVVEIAARHGYVCAIKDHPAEYNRLYFRDRRVEVIDAAMPVELVLDRYRVVVGMGSTGLLHFSKKAVSLLRVRSSSNAGSVARRVAHLCSLPEGKCIRFPDSLDELEIILIESKCVVHASD